MSIDFPEREKHRVQQYSSLHTPFLHTKTRTRKHTFCEHPGAPPGIPTTCSERAPRAQVLLDSKDTLRGTLFFSWTQEKHAPQHIPRSASEENRRCVYWRLPAGRNTGRRSKSRTEAARPSRPGRGCQCQRGASLQGGELGAGAFSPHEMERAACATPTQVQCTDQRRRTAQCRSKRKRSLYFSLLFRFPKTFLSMCWHPTNHVVLTAFLSVNGEHIQMAIHK